MENRIGSQTARERFVKKICIAVGLLMLALRVAQAQKLTRRRRDFPLSDLFEVVHRVQLGASGRRGQLPVDRFGRRHRASDQGSGGFWCVRHADDRRGAIGFAQVKLVHIPTVLGAVVPIYNVPGVQRSQIQRRGAGRHLPGQDRQLERCRRSPRTTPA